MDIVTATVSPLRQCMLDDMRMRQLAEHTQDGYIRAVRKLAAFLGRSPDTATIEALRRFQLHLVDAGTGPVTINATITGLGGLPTGLLPAGAGVVAADAPALPGRTAAAA